MFRLIKTGDDKYREYEELLIKREDVKKEAHLIYLNYLSVFGDLLNELFAAQIECIKLKKKITFCQAKINKGEIIDIEEMSEFIEKVMAEYYDRLEQMCAEIALANNMESIDSETLEKIKKIYRRLAKRLHPDINPRTAGNKELEELWLRISAAYRSNSLSELEDLEFLTAMVLNRLEGEVINVNIEDIDNKINVLREKIEEIMTTEPYTFEIILDDNDCILEKKKELREEIEAYKEYKRDLERTLNNIIESGTAATSKWIH
ncbi:MAG: DnaJ domain-containing protein [Anaerovoracaceae bacterium]|jgi:hypothetical protein